MEVFISVFKQSGLVCRLASEEMDEVYYIPEKLPDRSLHAAV